MPLYFEENQGQFESGTRYLARNADGSVRFTAQGPEFLLGKAGTRTSVQLRPVAAAASADLRGEDLLPGKVNYFLGNTPRAEFAGLPTYGKLRYSNFLPGVELTFYGTGHTLEHDFELNPGVAPSSVRFRLTGASSVRLNASGDLQIKTTASQMLFRKPVAYQLIDGRRSLVPVQFALQRNGAISFRTGKYDAAHKLVIDPVLVFSTYLDGTHADTPASITTDAAGNIYVAGSTTSPDFPVANSYQSACGLCQDGGFGESGFLAKLDPTGHTLLYSTFFVGNGQTDIDRIKIDATGNIIGTGYTASTNFPRVGKYSGSYASGLFVFSLNPAGTVLNHSEIVGQVETGYDGPRRYDLAVDTNSNVYVAGRAFVYSYLALNFPVTSGTYGSGKTILTSSDEIFLAKLASDGSLVYSTIIPPASASFGDLAMGELAIDATGNAYVSGTAGPGMPTTASTVSPSFPNGNPGNVADSGEAGFVLALDPTASQLLFSTYLPGTDNANTLARASDGSLYVAGTTSESTLPVSANAFQPGLKPGAGCTCDGGYILRLNATGTQVLDATYLSGTNDYNNTLTSYVSTALDASGNVYVGGTAYSTDFPMANPVVSYLDETDNITAGGTVLAGLTPDLTTLVFGSYFSGDGAGDRLGDMTISAAGRLVLTGGTFANTSFLTTSGAYQPNAPAQPSPGVGYQHEFVASIDLATPAPSVCLSTRSLSLGSVGAGSTGTTSLTLTNCGNAPLTVSSLVPTSSLVSAGPLVSNLAPGQSSAIQVQYTPVNSSSISGSFTITSNATVPTERFFFTGQGVASKISAVSSLTLASMVLGQTPATSAGILVQNTGNAPLTISSVSISGQFTQTNSCVRTIAVNSLCSINVTFAPTSQGLQQGSLTIVSNDPASPAMIALTATALSTFPTPVLTSLSEQTQVTSAANATLTLTGSNFVPQSVVRVNGKAATTTFISNTALSVKLDAARIATFGEVPITVVNPLPGGESNALILTLYQSIPNAGSLMTYVPTSGLLYLANNSSVATNPNTVVAANPATGVFGSTIAVGKDPEAVAASTDGSYLFVANRADATLQRIVTSTGTVDRTFPYPPNVFCTICPGQAVTGMQGVPGSPTSVVVAQGYLSLYGDSGLVNEISSPPASSVTFSGTSTHLYGYPFLLADHFFEQFSATPAGIQAITTSGTASSVTNEADFGITAIGNQIYTTSGNVWNADTKQLLTTLPLSIYNLTSNPYAVAIAPDPSGSRVYYGGDQASGSNSAVIITAYDTASFATKASLTFSDSSMIYTTNLTRWGPDGFAFLNGTSLILFRSSALSGTSLQAPVLTLTISDHQYGDAPFTVTAASNSSGAIQYAVLSGPATVSGNTVTITGVGPVALQAIQSAAGAYAVAETTATFNVSAAATAPTITFSIPNHAYGDAPFTVAATSSSTGALTYSVTSGPATVTGNSVTITGAGSVTVQVSQAAIGNYAAATQTATFQVSPAPLTAKANDASRVYGAANPTFTGTVTGGVYSDTFTESFITAATAASSAGTYSIVPSVSGPAAANYALTAVNGTLTITKATAMIALAVGNASPGSGQSSTFTATVTSASSGICTGSVTILDAGVALGSATLSGGVATYTVTLANGFTHHVSASYSGDTNCTAAATATDLPVTMAGVDTSATASPASQQVTPGGTVTYSLQLTPGVGSFPAPVTFSVQGLPAGFTDSFSPATVTVSNSPQTVQLIVQAPVTKAALQPPSLPARRDHPYLPFALAWTILPIMFNPRARRLLRRRPAALLIVCASATLLLATGCGGSSATTTTSQPPQNYTVTITATSGTVQHQTTVTLVW